MITWKIGGIFKADAEKVYGEIVSIGDDYTPQQIVDKARDESTELHKCFEWDDKKAAEKYRCSQAQSIIRMLVVKPEPTEENPKPQMIRAIVCQNENNNKYQKIQVTVRNEDSYQKLLRRALEELDAFKRKYSALAELEAVIEAIDEALNVA